MPHHLNLFNGEHFSPAYLKLNPKGVVPTLVHDGRVIEFPGPFVARIAGLQMLGVWLDERPLSRAWYERGSACYRSGKGEGLLSALAATTGPQKFNPSVTASSRGRPTYP